ncbi:hypothetical protein Plhal304r1_c031g0100771 [Plasmopara halstedii]
MDASEALPTPTDVAMVDIASPDAVAMPLEQPVLLEPGELRLNTDNEHCASAPDSQPTMGTTADAATAIILLLYKILNKYDNENHHPYISLLLSHIVLFLVLYLLIVLHHHSILGYRMYMKVPLIIFQHFLLLYQKLRLLVHRLYFLF